MARSLAPSTARRAGTDVWLALIVVYVVWGSTYLAIRVADETIPPFLMAGVRFLIGGTLLFAWSIRRGDRAADPIGAPQWRAAAVAGALLLLGGNGLLVWAELRVPTGVSALIIATVPIWMALFAARASRERVGGRTLAGLAIGFAGTGFLIRAAGSGGGHVSGIGVAAVFVGAISWAFGSIYSQRAALPRRPLVSTAMEMLCGGAMLVLVAAATGEFGSLHVASISRSSAIGLAYLIAFGSLVAFSAYVWLLQNASASLVSTYAYVNPVIAVLLGWAILDERVTRLTVVAAALIVGAVALIVLGQRSRAQSVADAPDEGAHGSAADAPPPRTERGPGASARKASR